MSVVDERPPPVSVCPTCGTPVRPGAMFCRTCGARLLEQSEATHESPLPAPLDPPPPDFVKSPALASPDPAAPAAGRDLAAVVGRIWARARRIRRRWWVTAGLAVVLGVGAAAYVSERVVYPPDRPVRQLFAALAARDTTTAGQLAGCAGSALCSGPTLSTGYTPPTDVTVVRISYGTPTDATRRPDKNFAYVEVRYLLAGQPQTSEIQLDRGDAGFNRPWSIVSGGYGYLDVVSSTEHHAQVGGSTVTTTATPSQPGGGLFGSDPETGDVLPGLYTVTAPVGDPLMVAPAQQVTIVGQEGPPSRTEVTMNIEIRPTIQSAIQQQVNASVDQCAAAATDLLALNCPFEIADGQPIVSWPGPVTWKITKYPVIVVKLSTDPDADGASIVVDTTTPGEAVGTWPDGIEIDTVSPDGLVTADAAGQPVYSG